MELLAAVLFFGFGVVMLLSGASRRQMQFARVLRAKNRNQLDQH